MKKIILMLLIIAVYSSIKYYAYAMDIVEVNVKYEHSTRSILISGIINVEKGDIPLTLEIVNPDGAIVGGFQTIARKDSKGEVIYQFEPVKLPYMAKGGVYTFHVSGHFINTSGFVAFDYLSEEDMLSLVHSVLNAQNSDFYTVVLGNAEKFGLSKSSMQNLNEQAQGIFNRVISKVNYTLPESIQTEEEIIKVKEAFDSLYEELFIALKIAEFNEISSQENLNTWLDECYTLFSFDENSNVTEESEEEISSFLSVIKQEKAFLNRVSAQNNIITLKDIQVAVYQDILLSVIETQNDYNVKRVIDKFTKLFPVNANLTSTQRASICSIIARKYYASYAEVTEAYNQAAGKYIDTPVTDNGNSGNSGKSSWGNQAKDDIIITNEKPADTQTSEKEQVFEDLDDVLWATKAISYLSKINVISGKNDGIFEPNGLVSRAEFVKMIVCSKKKTIGENEVSSFADVLPNAWYAPYFAAAKREGLIKGNGADMAFPEEYITRQDMAVLISRAFLDEMSDSELSFADSAYISYYARQAVANLALIRVINGVGDNKFDPLAHATRAQAAQMLYNILNYK